MKSLISMKKAVSFVIDEENHQKAKIRASVLNIGISDYIDKLISNDTKEIDLENDKKMC